MNRRPTEPLDSEERLLADQLARLGPHGEPSSMLDARILAAAHDAVAARPAVRRKPRWPVAMGLAASALLAVGIAWQLRPVDEMRSDGQVTALPEARMVVGEDAPAAADSSAAATHEELAVAAPQAAPPAPAAVALPPTPAKPLVMPRQAPAERVATREHARSAKRQAPAAEVAPAAEPAPANEYARAAAPPAPPPPAPTGARADATTLDSVATPAGSAQAYGLLGGDRPGFVADPETTAAIAAKREQARAEQARDAADAAEAARGGAEARARSPVAPKATTQSAPPPPAPTTSAPVAPAPASATRHALKRTDLQLPVSEDTKLPPEDWLERIRLRRDLGDRSSAADSLVRFKQNHPFQKVPDDLKELLGE
ncbi:hypothetical protein ACWKWK_06520 [Pseudoxanthomonas beigongshangi]